ncbi:hypothetical protein ABZ299_12400 [Streptomyces sp. NPDC006184]|uniref:hypothetical protein n=1 Tax=Streptomyces sp. NPDC006184 TaxID=3155455 RepID=UPI00339EC6DB
MKVNGWAFAAVAVVCVTVVGVVLLWAMVRIGQQRPADGAGVEVVELSAEEEFAVVQAHNRAGQERARRQIAEAAERARREREGGF